MKNQPLIYANDRKQHFRGDAHMMPTLTGGGVGKNEMLSDVGGWEVSQCSGCPIFIFFIKENWICTMTRHHANNILLARNLPFDSDVRQ